MGLPITHKSTPRKESPLQSLKDTFFLLLRDRVAALNPARTTVLRGVVRPAVLVEENELPAGPEAVPPDTFVLRWTTLDHQPHGAQPLTAMRCSVVYATRGTPGAGGMDRGRLLAAMDAELLAALSAHPRAVPKQRLAINAGTTTQTTDGTSLFWSDPVPQPATSSGGLLHRTTTVEVWAYGI